MKLTDIIEYDSGESVTVGEYIYGPVYKLFHKSNRENMPEDDGMIVSGPNSGRMVRDILEDIKGKIKHDSL